MQAFIPKLLRVVTQHFRRLTLYDMMRSSHDFQDVKSALNDRTDWSIELFRSCFTIHLSNWSSFFTLCALSFLVMAEGIHIHYGRLSPAELRERVESMGYATFAILFAVLDIGFVVVRVVGLAALSGSPWLATSLVLISMSPSVILPLLIYPLKLLKLRKRESGGMGELESGIVATVDKTQH